MDKWFGVLHRDPEVKSFLVCDDHSLMRAALAATIERCWPGSHVTLCEGYAEAFASAGRRFDLCICDLNMPGAEPFAGVQALLEHHPGMPLVVLTGTHDKQTVLKLLAINVCGIIPKSLASEIIEAAISLVLAGGTYFPQEVAAYALKASNNSQAASLLTGQQDRVMGLILEGLSNKEIALRLAVAPSTVNSHVDAILSRFSAKNRAEACQSYLKSKR
jgi:DNA-binding NarL/FixJ family response regulator